MGEQPIFTVKAHVFQIDPSTKKKWLPSSTTAVSVSYYYDSTRNTYRIISVENTKAIINSTISPNMTFTKTSQKFGQWSDPRANTVYGLGFASEPDCTKFVEKFKEIKELCKDVLARGDANGDSNHIPEELVNSSPVKRPSTPSSMQGDPEPVIQHQHQRRNSGSGLPRDSVVEQLKYENDRLKIALAQSSANAKKWEVELQTLKNNNARLTTALQESTANVEEWKKQLSAYKEESARMKKKVIEMEKMGGSELLQRQLDDMREKQDELEFINRNKDSEIAELCSHMQKLQMFETQNETLQSQIRELRSDNQSTKKEIGELQVGLDSAKTQNIRDKQQLRTMQDQLGTKIQELLSLHTRANNLLQS